jgi:hypothetical protein
MRRLAIALFGQARRARWHRRVLAQTRIAIGAYQPVPLFRIVFNSRLTHRWDAVYRREGRGYVLELCDTAHFQPWFNARNLGPAYLYWLMHCPAEVEHMSVTLSDGDAPGWALYSPSTSQPWHVPIPDPFFFNHHAFEWARKLARDSSLPWSGRGSEIVWRGASSGNGVFDPRLGLASPSLAAQRLTLCLAAREIPGVDIALHAYLRDDVKPGTIREYGILRQPIPEESWLQRKFAIDVDGQSNTWSNLIIRMIFGCCVLKVESQHGFRQWWYDRLRPWENFVPVKADCSDLHEKIEWVHANDRRAEEIAANGRALAKTLTFEAVRQEAVDIITRHHKDDDPYSPRTLPAISPRT